MHFNHLTKISKFNSLMGIVISMSIENKVKGKGRRGWGWEREGVGEGERGGGVKKGESGVGEGERGGRGNEQNSTNLCTFLSSVEGWCNNGWNSTACIISSWSLLYIHNYNNEIKTC